MTCPVYVTVHMHTEQVTFYKVPEKHRHVLLVTLYLKVGEDVKKKWHSGMGLSNLKVLSVAKISCDLFSWPSLKYV